MKKNFLFLFLIVCFAGIMTLGCDSSDSDKDSEKLIAVTIANQSDLTLTNVIIAGQDFGTIAISENVDAQIEEGPQDASWTSNSTDHDDFVDITECNSGDTMTIIFSYISGDAAITSQCL